MSGEVGKDFCSELGISLMVGQKPRQMISCMSQDRNV